MKPIYSQENFSNAKSHDKLPLQCKVCSKTFKVRKTDISKSLNGDIERRYNCCSFRCNSIFDGKLQLKYCTNCQTPFYKTLNQINKSKSGNHFCSSSCSATYNNKHKKHGTRRSKLESWIESQLTEMFPSLEIHFNRSDTIGSELDIYIPSLNLAFELNGIFHYEPIYGKDKLKQIQENDQSKTKACHDAKIDLCIIDTSTQKYFKPKTSKKYLDIISNIIKDRLSK